ncbi:MAG: ComEC/Rec2 family competence protein, partial [Fidelibacterota bacterium]
MLGYVLDWHWGVWAILAVSGLVGSRWCQSALLAAILALGAWMAPHYPGRAQLTPIDPDEWHVVQGVVHEARYRADRTDIFIDFLVGLPDSLEARRGLWRIYDSSHTWGLEEHDLQPGDTLLLRSRLQRPDGRRNPNGFDYRHYLWTQGVDVLVKEPLRVLAVVPYQGLHIRREMALIRQRIRGQLDTWLGRPQAGLAVGLLLGDKSGIDDDFRNRISALGIGHILAVSGLHVGYLLLVLMSISRLLPIPRAGQVFVIGSGLLGYVLLTGAPPSVVRASIMAFLYAWGRSLERRPDSWNLLAAAAIISLLIQPGSLFTPSFQLSFAAVAGILHIYPRLRTW